MFDPPEADDVTERLASIPLHIKNQQLSIGHSLFFMACWIKVPDSTTGIILLSPALRAIRGAMGSGALLA